MTAQSTADDTAAPSGVAERRWVVRPPRRTGATQWTVGCGCGGHGEDVEPS